MICALLLAAGEDWESGALAALDKPGQIVVLRRCVDVDDLMAIAASGQADLVVLALEAPGLDPSVTAQVRRHGVSVVGVTSYGPDDIDVQERAERLAIARLVAAADVSHLAEVVLSAQEDVAKDSTGRVEVADQPFAQGEPQSNRTVAVWGAGGAPGRTTIAINLAAEVARRGTRVLLADLDPYGGTVAQQLGILDEVSGILAVARLAGAGRLSEQWDATVRGVDEQLSVLTGLPRADRWREVRGAHVEQLLGLAAQCGHVVADTGFSVEDDAAGEFSGRPTRNTMTLTALEAADEIVVVGAADPVGLARLARGLVALREYTTGVRVRVVVNRTRSSIGWSEQEVAAMVDGVATIAGLHFIPEDRAGMDRALVTGRSLVEVGGSAVAGGIEALADAVFPDTVIDAGRRKIGFRTRRAGRVHQR